MSSHEKPFTIIESPFSAPNNDELVCNVQYAILAVRDSLSRGEAPYASHLFFTQMLDDNDSAERNLGIDAGLSVGQNADQTAVYIDRGISRGMEYGIASARKLGRAVVERSLFGNATPAEIDNLIQQEYAKHNLPNHATLGLIYGRIIG